MHRCYVKSMIEFFNLSDDDHRTVVWFLLENSVFKEVQLENSHKKYKLHEEIDIVLRYLFTNLKLEDPIIVAPKKFLRWLEACRVVINDCKKEKRPITAASLTTYNVWDANNATIPEDSD